MNRISSTLTDTDVRQLVDGRHGDPFAILGPHETEQGQWMVRLFKPGVEKIEIIDETSRETIAEAEKLYDAGIFQASLDRQPPPYMLRVSHNGETFTQYDAYAFGPTLSWADIDLFANGQQPRIWKILGAHPVEQAGVKGTRFAVWAPNASRVAVIGDFNDWDGRLNGMRRDYDSGIWDVFIPGVQPGALYKYEIRASSGDVLPLKADPVGFGSEQPPNTASIVRDGDHYVWGDQRWLEKRAGRQSKSAPISVYEVHLASWKRRVDDNNRSLSYRELADELVRYVKDLGFTHIEVLPVSEYPFNGSWGYQPVGLFAPTSRHGTLNQFRAFVEACHAADIGLIVDWVPGHFPTDPHGLARFDGTALYEYADPREGFHQDWNTYIYNYARWEVQNFLVSNARYWLEAHHVDGLRVDAVASMLYRDYSRKDGEWAPNVHGGRENLEAIALLQRLNVETYGEDASIMTIAEESTAWPGVTRPVHNDGLGFGYKWNMGWMHDTLSYMQLDPIHRQHHHNKLTFGLTYAFSENFVLAISHDEVVHGKGSLFGKMPGDDRSKFANLRTYYAFMWGHPGKKLLFMGCEFGQRSEWNHDRELDWSALSSSGNAGIQNLVRQLNTHYANTPALHELDHEPDGFRWLDVDAASESVVSWVRFNKNQSSPVVCVFNMAPVKREGWRLGVPTAGHWRELLNTDSADYGGDNAGNLGGVNSEAVPAHGYENSIPVVLPPMSGLYFSLDEQA